MYIYLTKFHPYVSVLFPKQKIMANSLIKTACLRIDTINAFYSGVRKFANTAKYYLPIFLFTGLSLSVLGQKNMNYGKKGNAGLILKNEVHLPDIPIFSNDLAIIDKQNTLIILSYREILFFDIDKSEIFNKTSLPDNSLNFNSIRHIDHDRILLGSGMPYQYFLINYSGKIIKRFDMNIDLKKKPDYTAPYLEYSYGNTLNSILYLAGSSVTIYPVENEIKPLIALNINTGEKQYLSKYPEEYKQNRGGMQNNYHYLCTNNKNEVIISYPACNDLIIYNPERKVTTRKNAGSSFITKLIPTELSNPEITLIKEEYNKYFFTTPSYEQVVYDKYRELYYRVAMLPNSEYGKKNSFNKPKTLIILDKNFSFLGETFLEPDFMNLFVYPEGVITITQNKRSNKVTIKKYEIQL